MKPNHMTTYHMSMALMGRDDRRRGRSRASNSKRTTHPRKAYARALAKLERAGGGVALGWGGGVGRGLGGRGGRRHSKTWVNESAAGY